MQLAVAALVLAPASLVGDGAPALDLPAKAWVGWLTMGAASTGLGSVVFYWLIQRVGSVRTSLVTYIVPTVGLVLGAKWMRTILMRPEDYYDPHD